MPNTKKRYFPSLVPGEDWVPKRKREDRSEDSIDSLASSSSKVSLRSSATERDFEKQKIPSTHQLSAVQSKRGSGNRSNRSSISSSSSCRSFSNDGSSQIIIDEQGHEVIVIDDDDDSNASRTNTFSEQKSDKAVTHIYENIRPETSNDNPENGKELTLLKTSGEPTVQAAKTQDSTNTSEKNANKAKTRPSNAKQSSSTKSTSKSSNQKQIATTRSISISKAMRSGKLSTLKNTRTKACSKKDNGQLWSEKYKPKTLVWHIPLDTHSSHFFSFSFLIAFILRHFLKFCFYHQ